MLFWMSAFIISTLVACITPTSYKKILIFSNPSFTMEFNKAAMDANALECAKTKIRFQLSNTSSTDSLSQIDKSDTGCCVIHVKFAAWADMNDPMQLIPYGLQKSVVHLRRLTTLNDQQLNKTGASHFKRWFEITLKPGTSLESVIKQLQSLNHIEVVEQAPRPALPP